VQASTEVAATATYTPLPPAAPTTTPLQPMMSVGGAITGIVLYNEMRPLSDLEMWLFRQPIQPGDTPIYTTTTNAQGEYAFTDVPFGQYIVSANYESLRQQGYYGFQTLADPRITISPTQTIARLDFGAYYKLHIVRPFDNKDFQYMQYPSSERALTLQWEPLPDAEKYWVIVYDRTSGSLVVDQRDLIVTEMTISTEADHDYSVDIRAYRGQIQGAFVVVGRYEFELIAQ
jgi:hypothetical protein